MNTNFVVLVEFEKEIHIKLRIIRIKINYHDSKIIDYFSRYYYDVFSRRVRVHLATTVHLELLIDTLFLVKLVSIGKLLQRYQKWTVQFAMRDIIVIARGCRYL